jgi:hypothetical protein
MRGLLPHYPSGTMNDATPDGAPRGGSETKNSRKTPDSRASERSEEVVHRREYDFYGSCVNQIDSCLFLQSQITPVLKKTNYWSFCKRSAIEQQPSYQYQTVKQ